MRSLLHLLLVILTVSCNNSSTERLETDVREIKQTLQRIESLLGAKRQDTSPTSISTEPYGNSYEPVKKQPSSGGRCNAITKKGTQCSRKARSGGYCWQHGG